MNNQEFNNLINDLVKLEELKKPIPAAEIEKKRREVFPDSWIEEQSKKADDMIKALFK